MDWKPLFMGLGFAAGGPGQLFDLTASAIEEQR